jgi:hypothetical protein
MELRETTEADEIRDLSDEHYMLLALDLANWRPGAEVPDGANAAWKRLTTDTSQWTLRWATIRTDPSIKVSEEALEFGRQVRANFERLLAGDPKALKAMRATADAALDQVKVRTQLRMSERGALVHLHSYTAGGGDGPLGLFLSFLLDPDRRFGRDLRRCRLPDCGRFFFVPLGRKGGRIPSYCPDTDHQRRHDAQRAPIRVQRHRNRKHK